MKKFVYFQYINNRFVFKFQFNGKLIVIESKVGDSWFLAVQYVGCFFYYNHIEALSFFVKKIN